MGINTRCVFVIPKQIGIHVFLSLVGSQAPIPHLLLTHITHCIALQIIMRATHSNKRMLLQARHRMTLFSTHSTMTFDKICYTFMVMVIWICYFFRAEVRVENHYHAANVKYDCWLLMPLRFVANRNFCEWISEKKIAITSSFFSAFAVCVC